ncbi:hypothetical protein OPV22_009712 [Ensete ventricosum]|uniref:CASP-like protein n=1 Tax=Ensete ventricosum TaxID=4639 RepID=A0AAV8Q0D3_ENSVE|nr:hypothetical protein OPV22_009712 [Ensete ventricosum]
MAICSATVARPLIHPACYHRVAAVAPPPPINTPAEAAHTPEAITIRELSHSISIPLLIAVTATLASSVDPSSSPSLLFNHVEFFSSCAAPVYR